MSEACAEPTERLPSIFPGSWINGDFYIWMGHADDHRAWSQLVDARRALEGAPTSTPPKALALAREELFVAEGSDWFWWYGDDHSSEHDRQFDELFRRHVRNIYDGIGRPIPAELFTTNITTEPTAPPDNSPECLIQPLVDGEITSYFEWMGAGCTDLVAPAGAMHASGTATTFERLAFGCDRERLFVRIDATGPVLAILQAGVEIQIRFITPAGVRATVRAEAALLDVSLERQTHSGRWEADRCAGVSAAAASVLEVAVPFTCLGVRTRDIVAFIVSSQGGTVPQSLPTHEPAVLQVPA